VTGSQGKLQEQVPKLRMKQEARRKKDTRTFGGVARRAWCRSSRQLLSQCEEFGYLAKTWHAGNATCIGKTT
jgi:hypothetical protein